MPISTRRHRTGSSRLSGAPSISDQPPARPVKTDIPMAGPVPAIDFLGRERRGCRTSGLPFEGRSGPTTPYDRSMISRILTVGGFTLVSRVTGFLRDIVLAALLGAGPVADAFFVALRLPNHFRAIFAEGAFSAAFVPAYARVRTQGGADPARLFADRIFTLLFASQVVLLAVAL